MKVHLLHPDVEFDTTPRLPWHLSDMIAGDLELSHLYAAMADDDEFLLDVVGKVVPAGLTDPAVIVYRQEILADVLANEAVVRRIYDLASEASEVRHKVFLGAMLRRDPEGILRRSVRMLECLGTRLKALRELSDRHAESFRSRGFRGLFATIGEQLSDAYLGEFDAQLAELNMPRGVLLSARLGLGNKGRDYTLHLAPQRSWRDRISAHRDGYGFTIAERDEAGSEALTELSGRALDSVAAIAAESADHVRDFFDRLRVDVAFYLGCTNLYHRLTAVGAPICFPTPDPLGQGRFSCRGLRDTGLCLIADHPVTGNDVDAEGASIIMVTGANEGGKSTFLRSVGVAQMMMQAGMFVTADSFESDVRDAVFTHFKREEDATMTHGKLDEELARMSEIADAITPQSLLLCNESFASTNEREGSQIARDVIDAAVAAGVKVVFVTHLYDLAHSLYARHDPGSCFLRAQRLRDGTRTFRLRPGAPESTSYGIDSFRRVFGVLAGG